MRASSLAIAAFILLAMAPLHAARASCAEDLTRIQLAAPNHPPDVRARLEQLTRGALEKMRSGDAQGCDHDTAEARQLLQLPALAPLTLSTPIAGAAQTAQANMPSNPERTTPASPDSRNPANAAPATPARTGAAGGPSVGTTGIATSATNAAARAGSGPASEAKAASGEGATGPTAGSGHPAANAATGAAAEGGDAAHGAALAQAQCGACHSFQPGAGARVGPDLFGVAQRRIASTPGFSYSAALKAHQGSAWSPATLDAFLKSPTGFAPGTRMAFGGVASDQDRRDLVAFLETLSGNSATGASR
jgi:cytochrome c2